jgi:hypothetical protein
MAGKGLIARLEEGPVICAEGYLFELERRGYLQAGAFVPEAVLDHPEVVEQLHRDFVHAGSDVVEAFTYYAHREKLRIIGREKDLEPMNRQALAIAKRVADETGTLFAGNICNTNIWDPEDKANVKAARAMFEEQVGWAAEAGADFIIGETYGYVGEALAALEAIKAAKLPAVMTMTIHRSGYNREGLEPEECVKRREGGGAREKRLARGAPRPLPDDPRAADLPGAAGRTAQLPPGGDALPNRARSLHLQPLRDGGVRPTRRGARRPLPRRLLRGDAAPHPRRRRGAGPEPAGEPLFGRYVEARLFRHGPVSPSEEPRLRKGAVSILLTIFSRPGLRLLREATAAPLS